MALKTRYSPLQSLSFQNLFASFVDLSPPRKVGVLVGLGGAVFLILFLPIFLFSGKLSSLKREISNSQKGYVQVVDKLSEYTRSKAVIDSIENQFGRPVGSLNTKIEGLAKQNQLTVDQIREKAPQETDFLEINSVEVKLSNVGLPSLVDFLSHLENDPTSPMRVRRLQIKPKFNNRQLLDVNFEVATFSVKKDT